jgi:hypothetical protein
MAAIRTVVCRPFARVLALGITAAVLLLPLTSLPAAAATVIGSPVGNMTCQSGTDTVQISTAGAVNSYAVPAGFDQITGWSTFGGAVTGQVALLVWRPVTGLTYNLVGESPLVTPTANVLNTYDLTIAPATPITVQAGDVIGLRIETTATCFQLPGATVDVMGFVLKTPAPSATETFTADPLNMTLDVSATLGTSAPPPPTKCDGDTKDKHTNCGSNGKDNGGDKSTDGSGGGDNKSTNGSNAGDNSNSGN